MSGWVNRKKTVAALVVLGVIWLLAVLFLDPLLKRGLITAGQAAAGAKVEIGALRTSLLKGSLTIQNVAVANKNDPMKNVVEFSDAALRFSPGAALRGKIVIPEAAIRGIQAGTARKTSGALARTKPSRLERLVGEQLAPAKANFEAGFDKAKAAAVEVDPRKLASTKGLEEARKKLDAVGDDWKKKVGGDQIEAQYKEIEKQVQSLQSGGNSPQDIARKAQAAAEAQKKIKALLAQVEQARASVNADIGGVRAKLDEARKLRDKDLDGLLKAAGLPSLDAESLTRQLLGPAASKKLSTALYWIAWARKRSASQAQKADERPPRRRGTNFEFPRAHTYPAFLLEKAELTGKQADLFQGRDMELSGTLTGVTSNAPLYGKPARLALKGAVPGGGPTMALLATVDQTRAPGATEVGLQYAGLPLSGLSLGDEQVGAGLKDGAARLNGTVRISGDEWKGSVLVQADGVKLEPKLALTGPAAGFASSALSGVRRFNATIGISGKEDDLKFSLSSDLGQTLADGMKQAVSGELAKQRAALAAKVDAAYAGQAKELQARTDALQKQLLGPLDAQKAKLDEQLRKATSQALGGKGLRLDKIFGR